MNEDLIIFLATIYGEAAGQSIAAKKAVAHVIMNRFGFHEWKKYQTIREMIELSGFDAYTQLNQPYQRAMVYFQGERNHKTIQNMEDMYAAVLPIFNRLELPQEKIVLYYSPKAQAYLHNKNPKLYTHIKPKWADSPLVKEVKMLGCENDDFAFYKYL